jgi:hypothetical protein
MAEANERAASDIIASFKALPTAEARQAVYAYSSHSLYVGNQYGDD